jgi:SAM-dependent methyltransferase
LRLLRLIEPTRAARLFGADLMASPEFVQFMRQDADVEILTVNLDPVGQHFTSKGYQEKVPLPDHSAQLVFALEIVEHLISPFHLMTEAHRILKSSGHFVITTPNVTRIGNIFKLLIGRSPNDRLAPPGYNDPNDEWRPHAREYAMHELGEMLRHIGFEIAEERFFLGEDTQSCRQPVSQHDRWAGCRLCLSAPSGRPRLVVRSTMGRENAIVTRRRRGNQFGLVVMAYCCCSVLPHVARYWCIGTDF